MVLPEVIPLLEVVLQVLYLMHCNTVVIIIYLDGTPRGHSSTGGRPPGSISYALPPPIDEAPEIRPKPKQVLLITFIFLLFNSE